MIYVNTLIETDKTPICSSRYRCIVCNSSNVWLKIRDEVVKDHLPMACSFNCVNLYRFNPLGYTEVSTATLPRYTLRELELDTGELDRSTLLADTSYIESLIPEYP